MSFISPRPFASAFDTSSPFRQASDPTAQRQAHLYRPQEDIEEEDDMGFIEGLGRGVLAGGEGFVRSIYDLADTIAADALPDLSEDRFFERPTTITGGLVEGITQFGLGLIPGLGTAGLIGKAGTALKLGAGAVKTAKAATAGVTADFVAFDAHEERLSNILKDLDNPLASNAITEYLAADIDDGEFEGRMKNVLEGGAIGGATVGVFKILTKGVKALKKAKASDGSPEALEAVDQASKEVEEASQAQETVKQLIEETNKALPKVDTPASTVHEFNIKDPLGLADRAGGDETIETISKQLDRALKAGSSDEFDGIANEVVASRIKALESKGKLSDVKISDINAQLLMDAKRFGGDVRGIEDFISNISVTDTVQAGLELMLKQQFVIQATSLSATKAGKLAKEVLNLETSGASANAIQRAKTKAVASMVQLDQQLLLNSQLGTIFGKGLANRRARAFDTGSEEIAESLVEAEKLRKGSNDFLATTNETLDVLDEIDELEPRLNTLDEGTPEKAVNTLDESVSKGEERLKTLNEKLEKLRKNFMEGDGDASVTEKKKLAEEDPEIKELKDVIKYYEGAISTERKLNKLYSELDRLSKQTPEETAAEVKGAKKPKSPETEAAKIRKKIQALKNDRVKAVNADLKQLDINTRKDFAKFLGNRLGSEDVQTVLKRIARASDAGEVEEMLHQVRAAAQDGIGTKLLRSALQVFTGNILSGTTTFVLNVATPAMAMVLRNVEKSAGALMAGDMDMLKASTSFNSSMLVFKQALKNAQMGMKTGRDVVTGKATMFDETPGVGAIDPSVYGVDIDSGLGQTLNFLNRATNLPNRINAAGDQFNKTVAAYQYIHQHFTLEGIKRGLKDGAELAEFVEKNTRKMFLEDGSLYSEAKVVKSFASNLKAGDFDSEAGVVEALTRQLKQNVPEDSKEMSLVSQKAAEYAQNVTFTGDAGATAAALTRLKQQQPIVGFLLPFINTPMNILKFGLERSVITGGGTFRVPTPLLSQKAKEARIKYANARTEVERAEIRGRIATAAATTSALVYFAGNGDGITGGGPRNREEKKALEATGWRPYSFVRTAPDGTKTYISYQRLDPLATIIGIVADLAEHSKMNPNEEKASAEALSGLAFGLAESLTDKSFLRGINNLLNVVSDPETYLPKTLKDIASGMAVPMFVDKIKNVEGEQMIRESRTLADSILRKMPIAEENVAPKRTFLGEPMYKQNPLGVLGMFNPIYVSSKKNDIVDKEVQSLLYGFSTPSPNYINHPDTDMREFRNAEGREAYDRYLELSSTTTIGGRNLRQALKGLMTSRFYKNLVANMEAAQGEFQGEDPRIAEIKKVIGRYRRKAKREMIAEFPELEEKSKSIINQQRSIMRQQPINPIPSF